uniref:Alpha-1,3-glucosyltransferase n=1 Tax=Pristionchus pacificus TaxID=54126 RepID=A0A8R1UG83_PRIPA
MKKGQESLSSISIPIVIGLIAVKILLYDSYSSTDIEVHRNWKAIAHNLPLSQWYKEKTSQWTLDYPPFFAYFEKFLGRFASFIGMDDILSIQSDPLMNNRVLYFMRSTVLASDFLYLMATVAISSMMSGIRSRNYLFILLSTHTMFILLDNIHFQYNAMLTALVILSIVSMMKGRFLLAAFLYSILLNFKHIYLYYAPGFVVTYLIHWFDSRNLHRQPLFHTIKNGVSLLVVLLLPFIFSLTPFLISSSDPLDALQSIISRLFPIQRGLTHAYWAPNAWAIYNTADLVLNKVMSKAGIHLSQPEYTSGLVQEYTHTVLPTIGMGSSLICVILSLFPLLSLIRLERSSSSSSPLSSPSFHLLLSSLSFFFFGYHVHEKALILPLIPLIILTAQYAIFSPLLLDLTMIVSSSLSPLLFSTPELPLRLAFMLFQFSISLLFVCRVHHQNPSRYLTPIRVTAFIILSSLEIVNSYADKLIFPSSPFISLLLISLVNSILLLTIFLRLLSLAFPFPLIQWKKWRCLRKERQYLDDSCIRSVEREDVVIVAAVDIEVTSKDPTLAVISAVFFDINKGMKLESFSEVIPYPQLYIPHFLALSEEPHVCELMKKVMKDRPELKPQVIICDGNGRFHPRRFGLACHVAASTGIPTIGVSKNMDWGVIGGDMNGRKVYGERLKKLLSNLPQRLGSSPLDFFLPHTLNVISYPKSTKHVFVSSGLGISLETSTQIILELMGKGIAATAEADNLARRIASQISSL